MHADSLGKPILFPGPHKKSLKAIQTLLQFFYLTTSQIWEAGKIAVYYHHCLGLKVTRVKSQGS